MMQRTPFSGGLSPSRPQFVLLLPAWTSAWSRLLAISRFQDKEVSLTRQNNSEMHWRALYGVLSPIRPSNSSRSQAITIATSQLTPKCERLCSNHYLRDSAVLTRVAA